jgi:hypothetical protein
MARKCCAACATPGEIIHIAIKKLARFNRVGHRIAGNRHGQANQRSNGTAPGWEFAQVAIDDHSRVAKIDIFPNEKKDSAVAFLKTTVADYRNVGVKVTRVMTDNRGCYRLGALPVRARACASSTSKQGPIRHRQTARLNDSFRPPCENGHTPPRSKIQTNDETIAQGGCITTTATGPMRARDKNHQSAG